MLTCLRKKGWFVISVETQRILHADLHPSLNRGTREEPVESPHKGRVQATDRIHIDDLAVDEFDPVIGVRMPASAIL